VKQLKFHGYSDDTFGEYGVTMDDYDNCASGSPIQWLVESPSQHTAFVVVGRYDEDTDGVWEVGIRQYAEGTAIPQWPMRFEHDEHSAILLIDCPDDVAVTCLNRAPADKD